MTTIRTYLDLVLGALGAALVLGAVTLILGYPYALLGGGVFLLVLAVVLPPWA